MDDVLYALDEILSQWSKDITMYDLPKPSRPNPKGEFKVIQAERNYDEEALQKVVAIQSKSLNRHQLKIFRRVKHAVDNKKPLLAFIDGPGGSGINSY